MSANTPQYGEMATPGEGDNCYRHPERPSFTLCQRCGRTICPECQQERPVGVLCPECVRELQPAKVTQFKRSARSGWRRAADTNTPIVTYALMGICVAVWVLQLLVPGTTALLAYLPAASTPFYFEPWRLLTSIFTHSSSGFTHILFNMYSLWLIGANLERMLGKLNYLLLYLLSGLGGSTAVMLWSLVDHQSVVTATVGASGALFGVFAATLVVFKFLNINVRTLAIVVLLNLGIGFMPGMSISWQAHVGGLITGGIVMALLTRTVPQRKQGQTFAVFVGALVALLALSVIFYAVSPSFFGA